MDDLTYWKSRYQSLIIAERARADALAVSLRDTTEALQAINRVSCQPPNGIESGYSGRQRRDISDLAQAALSRLSTDTKEPEVKA